MFLRHAMTFYCVPVSDTVNFISSFSSVSSIFFRSGKKCLKAQIQGSLAFIFVSFIFAVRATLRGPGLHWVMLYITTTACLAFIIIWSSGGNSQETGLLLSLSVFLSSRYYSKQNWKINLRIHKDRQRGRRMRKERQWSRRDTRWDLMK